MTVEREEEFAVFAQDVWGDLIRSARLMGAGPHDAEDAAQLALEKCLNNWNRVRHADAPKAYAIKTLFNTLLARRRLRGASELVTDTSMGASQREPATAVETRLDLEAALASLSADQRSVVVMRYYLDLTESQISDALGVPRGTVKSRHARALAHLGVQLTESTTA